MNWGGAPMSSCSALEDRDDIVALVAQCFLHALGVDRAAARPLLDGDLLHLLATERLRMHQAIPDRSVSWPINSSSGTRVASSVARQRGVPTCHEGSCRHDWTASLTFPCCRGHRAFLLGLLALGDHALERTVDLRAQREARRSAVTEDRDLAELLSRHLARCAGSRCPAPPAALPCPERPARRCNIIRRSRIDSPGRLQMRAEEVDRRSARSTRRACLASPSRRPAFIIRRGPSCDAVRPSLLLRLRRGVGYAEAGRQVLQRQARRVAGRRRVPRPASRARLRSFSPSPRAWDE